MPTHRFSLSVALYGVRAVVRVVRVPARPTRLAPAGPLARALRAAQLDAYLPAANALARLRHVVERAAADPRPPGAPEPRWPVWAGLLDALALITARDVADDGDDVEVGLTAGEVTLAAVLWRRAVARGEITVAPMSPASLWLAAVFSDVPAGATVPDVPGTTA